MCNSEQFDGYLGDLGWSRRGFASRLGLHYNTVNAWGKTVNPPKYALAYLELAIAIQRLGDILGDE